MGSTTRHDWRDRVRDRLASAAGRAELEAELPAHSNLPGPRSNLELAAGFADACGAAAAEEDRPALLAWLQSLAAIAPEQAGDNDPRAMLPISAVQALGAMWPVGGGAAKERAAIEAAIGRAADDPRWRLREAAAMALQRLGGGDPVALKAMLERWMGPQHGLLRQRAVLAALADPPLLADDGMAELGLAATDAILERFARLSAQERRADAAVALHKGLSYAPSLFVEKLPQPGFALLKRWARRADTGISRAIRANLGKARLAKRYPREVEALARAMDDGDDAKAGNAKAAGRRTPARGAAAPRRRERS